jgi:hypothetical protein
MARFGMIKGPRQLSGIDDGEIWDDEGTKTVNRKAMFVVMKTCVCISKLKIAIL